MSNCSTNQKAQTYQVRVSNHRIGEVTGGKFKKRIQFSRHALRTPPALALSVESLRQAEQFGAREIEITDLESGRVYSCTLEYFYQYSWQIQRGGFEPQRALALERWAVTVTEQSPRGVSTTSVQPAYGKPTATSDEAVKPYVYKSYAPVGVKFTKGKTRQIDMFDKGGRYE